MLKQRNTAVVVEAQGHKRSAGAAYSIMWANLRSKPWLSCEHRRYTTLGDPPATPPQRLTVCPTEASLGIAREEGTMLSIWADSEGHKPRRCRQWSTHARTAWRRH